ncbi:LysR family transcriptional regulator [Pseudomonas sessilinigenes]|uniref:LysR family transcriptional regulator n=1 Tax=Pseudomonas sessilinigenes TaxID=658629 RepID=A0ABX8MWH8_9PSED|nr:LysR family transcriptional regulator [Pseudomonas sessilinigenes]AZC24656.1 Transcriptional regulator, LysR family [Pseudomonas sessilinigenes]QXH43580.1 LysR family transcriptional regulator [Pseudomonas sessilinigenes]
MRKTQDNAAWRIFFRVVERGSLTLAADDLHLEPSSVSRQLTALEHRLNTQLLNRSTRKVSLTPAGTRAYEHMRPLLEAMDALLGSLDQSATELSGRLRVSAPVALGEHHVSAWLADFQGQHPQLTLDLVLSDRVLDLMAEGIDVALRIGHLPASSLVARPLGQLSHGVYASPGYLQSHGTPLQPADLPAHRALVYSWMTEHNPTQLTFKHQAEVAKVELDARFFLNNLGAIHRALLAGAGLHAGPDWLLGPSARRGELVRLLPQWQLPTLPVNLVRLHNRFVPQRISALCDWLDHCWQQLPDVH